jgi:hypothetical protein
VKVLFVSGSKNDVVQLWYSSGCHLEHNFEHITITTIDSLLGKIRAIEPDVIVVSYNVGSQSHTGVDVALLVQEDFSEITLVENTVASEESFSHRDVKVEFNVECDPEKLARFLKGVAA